MWALERAGELLQELGETDCEALESGVLAQPVNAVSSLSYVIVGIAVALAVVRWRPVRSGSLVYAGCLAAIGLGSVAFHGPQTSGSQLMHDVPILVTALFMLDHDRVILWPNTGRALPTFAGLTLIALVIAILDPGSVTPLIGVVVGAVVIAEAGIYRRRLRPFAITRQRRVAAMIAVSAAVGGAFWLLGRSSSPLCAPDSVFQLHGLWHVVSAGAFALWYLLALADDR